MTYSLPTEKTLVKRLLLRNANGDSGSARLRLTCLLNAASLSPHGLEPSAILCIRKLPDPRPGTLRLNHAEVRPPSAWEQAAVESLDQLARRAARPALGAVPAHAEAVLFADQAELLACLANDWREGLLAEHWWWPSLFPRIDPARLMLHAWLESPHYLPAALNQLAQWEQAVAIISALNTAETRALTQQIMRCFALNELEMAIQQATNSVKPESISLAAGAAQTRSAPAPWRAIASESDQLGVEQQLLLGVGLTLHRTPALARSLAFAREAAEWWVARLETETRPAVPTDEPPSPAADNPFDVQANVFASPATPISTEAAPQAARFELSHTDSFLQAEPITATALDTPTEGIRASTGPPINQTETIDSEQIPNFSTAHAVDGTTTRVVENALTTSEARLEPETISIPHPQLVERPEPLPSAFQVETQFGGVFYLINLGLFLNLYGDFTTPAQPGLALPLWDFVALMALELIGEEVPVDPVWPLLAQLTGRADGEPPGIGFDPPGQASVQDWLAEVTLTVRPRLRLALGISDDEDLPRFFRAPGRIVVTAARLDAFFALAELPIEIRLSGLDRDPGWVPAAGRTIAFHFD